LSLAFNVVDTRIYIKGNPASSRVSSSPLYFIVLGSAHKTSLRALSSYMRNFIYTAAAAFYRRLLFRSHPRCCTLYSDIRLRLIRPHSHLFLARCSFRTNTKIAHTHTHKQVLITLEDSKRTFISFLPRWELNFILKNIKNFWQLVLIRRKIVSALFICLIFIYNCSFKHTT